MGGAGGADVANDATPAFLGEFGKVNWYEEQNDNSNDSMMLSPEETCRHLPHEKHELT